MTSLTSSVYSPSCGIVYTNTESVSLGVVLRLDDLMAKGMSTSEIFDDYLAKTKAYAQKQGLHNVEFVLGTERDPKLPESCCDVAVAVYRRLDGDGTDERLPMPYVVRRAQQKDVAELSREIRNAQARPLAPGEQWLDGATPPPWLLRLGFAAPFHLRKWLYWDRMLGSPWRVKRTMGTVMVTSVPLTTRSGGGAWAIPAGVHPLTVVLGAVGHRPASVEGDMVARELLSMTVLFDHDVVDGVPVALFLRRLSALMEGAVGL